MRIGIISTLAGMVCFLTTTASYGFTINPEIIVSGFGNAGASVTNATNIDFIDPIFKQKVSTVPTTLGIGNSPVFNSDTLGGLQFMAAVNNQLSFTAQFVSEGLNNYAVQTDWLYAEWRINDNWDIKVGRVIVPLFLHYPYLKVNYAYLWSRLPVEFYNLPISNFEGILIHNTIPLWGGWKNDTNISLGDTSGIDRFYSPPVPFDETKGFLIELSAYNENTRVRASFTRANLELDVPSQAEIFQQAMQNPCAVFNNVLSPTLITLVPGPIVGTCQIADINSPFPFSPAQGIVIPDFEAAKLLSVKNMNTELYSLGYEVKWNNIISIAEWAKIFVSDKYSLSTERWYVLLAYNWDNITPHITFSTIRSTNNSDRVLTNTVAQNYVNPFSYFGPLPLPQPESFQTSVNKFLALNNNAQSTIDVGIRYDIGLGTALKFDYRYVMPKDTTGFFNFPPGKRISWVTALIAVVF